MEGNGVPHDSGTTAMISSTKIILVATLILSIAQPASAQTVAASFTQFQEKLGEAAVAKPSQEQLLTRISQDAFALQVVSPKIKANDAPAFAISLSYNAKL